MIVLGLDTTRPDCSVSLVDDAIIRAHICRKIGRGHAEVLAGMVAEVFDVANLKPDDVNRLAVCTGPGSFTGLRVALSFALGFALPRGLPVVGINALELTARALDPEATRRVAVQQDVRRGEFFYGLYENGSPKSQPRAMLKEVLTLTQADQNIQIVHDAQVDTRILAWLAIDLDPETHPAEPLYSRGPDAKLPGGKSL
jgi:tRNA threonylcarbamoyladenosine biosynthesis protein TsaB